MKHVYLAWTDYENGSFERNDELVGVFENGAGATEHLRSSAGMMGLTTDEFLAAQTTTQPLRGAYVVTAWKFGNHWYWIEKATMR